MQPPFFTIGIPTYNRAALLREAIAHVLKQTHPDFELLVLDNASPDSTPEVVREFSDARIRYVRQASNIGPLRNFQDMVTKARGNFLVLHQDDDLIHFKFLEHCRASVEKYGTPAIYAAPIWMGMEGGTCVSKLLAPPNAKQQAFMAGDEVLVFEGNEIAAQFLISIPFNFPSIALHTETFRRTGGFFEEFPYGGDIVTLGRFATFGRVFYDPRIGGFYRVHQTSHTAGVKKAERLRLHRLKLHRLIGFFDQKGIPWEEILRRQFPRFNSNELIHEFGLLVRYGAPKRLQACVFERIVESWKKSRVRLVRRLLHRIGLRNMFRFYWNQKFGTDLGPGRTLENSQLGPVL